MSASEVGVSRLDISLSLSLFSLLRNNDFTFRPNWRLFNGASSSISRLNCPDGLLEGIGGQQAHPSTADGAYPASRHSAQPASPRPTADDTHKRRSLTNHNQLAPWPTRIPPPSTYRFTGIVLIGLICWGLDFQEHFHDFSSTWTSSTHSTLTDSSMGSPQPLYSYVQSLNLCRNGTIGQN